MKTSQHWGMEDMQSYTFTLYTDMLMYIGNHYMNRNVEALIYAIDYLYVLSHMELKEEDNESIKAGLLKVKNWVYSPGHARNTKLLSQALDECRNMMMILTKSLRDQGILLKTRVDLDSLVAVRGG